MHTLAPPGARGAHFLRPRAQKANYSPRKAIVRPAESALQLRLWGAGNHQPAPPRHPQCFDPRLANTGVRSGEDVRPAPYSAATLDGDRRVRECLAGVGAPS